MKRQASEYQDTTPVNVRRRGGTTPESERESERIAYFFGLEEELPALAAEIGISPERLRALTETAVRTRRDAAYFSHESHRATGRQPDIFTLDLGPAVMFFTVESHAVVIRGYGYEIDREPLDDRDGGYFYCDADWR